MHAFHSRERFFRAFVWRMLLVSLALSCTPQGDPSIPADGFRDDFDRDSLGALWSNTGASWNIQDGRLHISRARNHPLWLRRRLPRDVRVEFDAMSRSTEGDIKFELFGDGVSKASGTSYADATSYLVIFGGWNNSKDVIARLDEHGADRVERRSMGIKKNKWYHIKAERRGETLDVWVDGKKALTFKDSDPLEGRGHDHFAFNNWNAELLFDNLVIKAL